MKLMRMRKNTVLPGTVSSAEPRLNTPNAASVDSRTEHRIVSAGVIAVITDRALSVFRRQRLY